MIWWIEQTFAVTALMAALAWGIGRIPRVPAKLRHLLWLAVIVKLLLPPVVAWPWALGGAERSEIATVHEDARDATMMARLEHWLALEDEPNGGQASGVAAVSKGGATLASVPAPPQNVDTNAAMPMAGSTAAPAAGKSALWRLTPGALRRALAAIWIAGMAGALALQLTRIARLAARLRTARPASEALERQLRQLAGQMNVRSIPARMVMGLDGPYIWSLMRPMLLWPADLPVDAAAEGLIAHELAHVKRRDHWVGWLELAAGIVWWWNPIYHVARRNLRANAELCCDAAVGRLWPARRRAYAESLLSVCERRINYPLPAAALGVKSAKRELAARLAAIMTEPAPGRLPPAAWATLLVLASAALPAIAQTTTALAKLPFTISKETTAITSPLKPDGTPDYIQALNDKYSRGVTPENNGFTLWMESFGGKDGGALSTSVYDKILQMADAKAPPADRTFPRFGPFLEKIKGLDPANPSTEQQVEALDALRLRPWRPQDDPAAAEYLKQYDADIDKAAAISARPKWWTPAVPGTFNAGKDSDRLMSGSMIAIMLPSLGQIREMSNVLCVRAMRRADAGDLDGAISDILAAKRFARHLSHCPTLIEQLVGVAIDAMSDASLAGWAASGKPTSDQCRVIERAVDALPAMGEIADSIDIGERWETLDAVVLASTRPGVLQALAPLVSEDPGNDAKPNTSFSAADRTAVDWDVVLKRANRDFDAMVATANLPTDAQRKESDAAIDKRLSEMGTRFKQEPTLQRGPEETREAYTERVANAIEAVFVPSLTRASQLPHESAMQADMARMLLAAADAKARTGKWPADAQELIGPLLPALPLDIYSDAGKGTQPLKYVLGPEGPTVYSIGRNGIDENGQRGGERKMDDIALPMRPVPVAAPGLP